MIIKENFTLKMVVTLVFCEKSGKNKKTHMLRGFDENTRCDRKVSGLRFEK